VFQKLSPIFQKLIVTGQTTSHHDRRPIPERFPDDYLKGDGGVLKGRREWISA
jgi:hypothetical protein